MQQNNKFLIYLLAGVILFLLFLHRTPSTSTRYQEKEVLYKEQIKVLSKDLKVLKSKDSVLAKMYQMRGDTIKILSKNTDKIKVVYRKAVEATNLTYDSTSLSNEVQVSRKLIEAQEAHIQAFVDLKNDADNLIKNQKEIIKNQEAQLMVWPERYDNMVAQKDSEIKAEKKKGNRKFLKGAAAGAAIVALLVLL